MSKHTPTDLTQDAILTAMDEYDRLGADIFLAKYGFATPKQYWVCRPNSEQVYPAKAIIGAAFGYLPGGTAWPHVAFTGGIHGANGWLERLGFTISEGGKPAEGDTQANLIRAHVLSHYIQPARERGQPTVSVKVGDVVTSLGIQGNHANVFQALRGDLFQAMARVPAPEINGTGTTSTVLNYRIDGGTVLDPAALAALKQKFLIQHADFRSFGDCPSFAKAEGDYKRALVARAEVIMVERKSDNDAALGAAVWNLLTGRDGLESNLIDWRAAAVVDDARKAHPELIDSAIGCLLRAPDDAVAITEFVSATWDAFAENRPSRPYAESRMTPSMLRALVRPEAVLPIRSEPTRRALKLLTGGPGFADARFSTDEFVRVQSMAMELRRIMTEQWGWAPRDMWDVQGFLWETCRTADLPDTDIPIAAEEKILMASPTNLILYGPPGTGKTYATAREAVLLCDGSAPSDRAELMDRYSALREAGRIGFVTFHQSYDYESFVEGLRPKAIEGGTGFTLEPTPGIFREIAQLALEAGRPAIDDVADTSATRHGLEIGKRQVFKMSLGESGTEEHIYEDALDTGTVSLGWGGGIDWTPFDSYEAIHARWNEDHPGTNGNDGNITQIYRFRVSMQRGDLVLVSAGNSAFRAIAEVTGDYTFDPQSEHPNRRAVRWLRVFDEPIAVDTVYNRKFSMRSCYRLRDEHLKREALQTLLAGVIDTAEPATGWTDERVAILRQMWEDGASANQIASRLGGVSRNAVIGKAHRIGLKIRPAAERPQTPATSTEASLSNSEVTAGPLQFVLVIDEINRGNISKIFGELITLIEPDKRLGMKPNELTVRLPYSGKEFGVPANLHIIGTMNTADRSIALLDTALRRRFTFREMAPDPDLLEPIAGINLAAVLKTINERVEYLLDREHRIGHAFFMGCKDKADIDAVMRDKVIPLLQEYFFEDFARVNAILGDSFIASVELKAPPGFEGHAEVRKSWSVRTEFAESAYHALAGKALAGVTNEANTNT